MLKLAVDLEVASELDAAALPDATMIEGWARAAVAAASDRARAELSVRIVDLDEGHALNARWRDRDRPTNVLSFPADLPVELGIPLLGDLVICAPVVAREAAEQGKAEMDHWAHLVVHGVLHLLGHDHEIEAEAEAMEALERRILAGLGIRDPYA
jgi:probable rRNA maturation factor